MIFNICFLGNDMGYSNKNPKLTEWKLKFEASKPFYEINSK